MRADLHCHSRISDGSLSIGEITVLAKRLGLGVLAIADHDTVEGLDEAETECGINRIRFIPAIEISAFDYKRNKKAHILGYMMDRPEAAGKACKRMLDQRQEVSKWIVSQLIEAGYPISWEDVEKLSLGSTNVYKQHIMHALMQSGYAESIHDGLYGKLFAKPKDGVPQGIAYREIEYMDAAEAVRVVRAAGGVAVLAHPAGYGNMDLIPELVEAGLDGLEAWHPSHDDTAISAIMDTAKKYSLVLTGGSDFHGMYEGGKNPLGSCSTPAEWLERLLDKKVKPALY
jgi:predicted metal-dependent phosphoesterase TrpH